MKFTRIGDLNVRILGGDDGDGGGRGPVVVLLHGFGAPADDLVPLGPAFAAPSGTRFVFPEGPVDLSRRGYAGGRAWWWFDLEERMRRQPQGGRDVNEVPEGLDAARAKVDMLLGGLEGALGPPEGRIVLGGFSQGAMLSLDVALRSDRALAGVVFMSGTHLAGREWAARFETRRGLPILMSHGQYDELLPFSISENLATTLAKGGFPVQWVPFLGGHGIAPDVVAAVSGFLGRVLPPAETRG